MRCSTSSHVRAAGFTVPAVAAAIALIAVVVALTAVALATPRRAALAPERTTAKVVTNIRDVLTGRRTQDDGTPVPPAAGPGSPGEPLRMHFVPTSDQAQNDAAMDGVLEFLRARTGYAIEGTILPSYGLVIESLIQGRTDIAFLTAASYARARFASHDNGIPEDDAVAFLQAVRQGNPKYPGSDLAYRAVFLVRSDSPLKSPADITSATRVAMGPPTSGASSILPSALLNELEIQPQVTRYLGGYPTLITALYQGAVDVACIWWSPPNEQNPQNDARITAKKALPDVFEKTRILGYTEWIPNEPVVARASVPVRVRNVIARALQLYIADRTLTPEGRRELEAVGSLVGYITATDKDFDPLIDTIKRAFANDPEGWADFQRSSK